MGWITRAFPGQCPQQELSLQSYRTVTDKIALDDGCGRMNHNDRYQRSSVAVSDTINRKFIVSKMLVLWVNVLRQPRCFDWE